MTPVTALVANLEVVTANDASLASVTANDASLADVTAKFAICAEATVPDNVVISTAFIFVPSEYNILIPLSVVDQVVPVPPVVLNSTVNAPVVPFDTIQVFSIPDGTVTI